MNFRLQGVYVVGGGIAYSSLDFLGVKIFITQSATMQSLIFPSSHVPLVLKHPESLALVGEGDEEVEEVLDRLRKDHRLREAMEKEAEEDEKVLALGLGRFQRRMLVAVTSFADSLLDYALAIAKPASLTTSSWLQELALTLYTRWGSCNGHSTKSKGESD